MPELPDVRPGQVWADNDPRAKGRLIRIQSVHAADDAHPEDYVRVTVERVGRNVAKKEDGEQRTIKRRRFRGTLNGYVLVEDAPAAQAPYPKEEASASEVSDRLMEAAGIIRQRGWQTEKTVGDGDGPVSLLGAIVWAFNDHYGEGWEETPEFAKAYEVVHAQLPDDVPMSQVGLTQWNRDEGRTQEEVVGVLQRAARVAHPQANAWNWGGVDTTPQSLDADG